MADAASTTLHAIASSAKFKDRTNYYMVKAAIAVKSETLATAGHSERSIYADNVLDAEADIFEHALASLTNGTLAAAADITDSDQHGITDSDLEFAVNEMWNAMSGFDSGP